MNCGCKKAVFSNRLTGSVGVLSPVTATIVTHYKNNCDIFVTYFFVLKIEKVMFV